MEKHTKRTFWLQCLMVGANPKKIDPYSERWFMEYAWTKKRERLFVNILTAYLHLSKGARAELLGSPWAYKGKCRKAAKEWAWFCGWKYKD